MFCSACMTAFTHNHQQPPAACPQGHAAVQADDMSYSQAPAGAVETEGAA